MHLREACNEFAPHIKATHGMDPSLAILRNVSRSTCAPLLPATPALLLWHVQDWSTAPLGYGAADTHLPGCRPSTPLHRPLPTMMPHHTATRKHIDIWFVSSTWTGGGWTDGPEATGVFAALLIRNLMRRGLISTCSLRTIVLCYCVVI